MQYSANNSNVNKNDIACGLSEGKNIPKRISDCRARRVVYETGYLLSEKSFWRLGGSEKSRLKLAWQKCFEQSEDLHVELVIVQI